MSHRGEEALIAYERMRAVSNGLLSRLLKYHGDNPPDRESAKAVAAIRSRLFPTIHREPAPKPKKVDPVERILVEAEARAAELHITAHLMTQAVKVGEIRRRRERCLNRVEMAFEMIRGGHLPEKRTMACIMREVALKHGLSLLQMRTKRRTRVVVLARHEAMYRCHHETTQTLPQIARFFGGFDHSSVMHAIAAHAERASK